jgi:hypothetical protein
MPVPDFSPGEVLTAAAMDSIGLWRVGGGTFSGVGTSGQSFTAFTSDYDNYQLVFSNVSGSTAGGASFVFRLSSGATPSSTGYFWAGSYASYATTPVQTNFGNSNGSSIYLADQGSNQTIGVSMIVQAPRQAQWTMLRWQGTFIDNNVQGNGVHKVNTAYDSFWIAPGSGTVTGRYDIYGYRK